jgi:hypothetical protein
MQTEDLLDRARAVALDRWTRPFPGFASGHDKRTSDEALLTLTYGGLVHAAQYEWLNAGRRLIDKTYIDMLLHVQGLSGLGGVRAERIAAALDSFIVELVRPAWRELSELDDDGRLALSVAWVEQMASNCFGSIHSETMASCLMFYLFPMLPVFNLGQDRRMALVKLGHPPDGHSYRAFAHAAMIGYQECLPRLSALPHPPLAASVRDPDPRLLYLGNLLTRTDWWTRAVFDKYLLHGAQQWPLASQKY